MKVNASQLPVAQSANTIQWNVDDGPDMAIIYLNRHTNKCHGEVLAYGETAQDWIVVANINHDECERIVRDNKLVYVI